MVRVTCLSPTKSYSYYSSAFAHLKNLILQSSNSDSSTRSNHRANIQSKQKDTSNKNTPKQKKDFKRAYYKIGLATTITRTQETRKTELKRRFYGLNGALGI